MDLTFAQCETIMKTLPIGYYTTRRIETSLDEEADTSFYSPMEDKIVVSYPIIAHRMKNVSTGVDVEEAVRSMLYHEVSHAILTHNNKEYFNACFENNCMEDERIETVLKDYYMNTNFKKQLLDIYGGKIPEAKDKQSAFYNAVRFRCAPDHIKKRVEEIIKQFATLNRTSDYRGWLDYRRAIADLYYEVSKEFEKDPQAFQPPENMAGGEGPQQTSQHLRKSAMASQEGEEGEEGMAEGVGEETGEDGEKSYEAIETESPLSREQLKRMVGASLQKHPPLSDKQQKRLDEFTKTVEVIISNFNKKNAGGSGINAYSGVFNPRAVIRKDYRYFERAMTTQGNNKFGTCHLNLFIDSSGSMCNNEDLVNGILASLTEIERKNRNFSMDVSFIDHNYKDCKTIREREYSACGGNTIPEDMKERFLKRQLPNTCNYNIVLFDGDAICNERMTQDEAIRRFGAFDYKQTTLITDPDNEQYLGKGFNSAKVVVTQNYTEELLEHITKALTIAFG